MQDIIVTFGSPEDTRKIKSILMRNGYRVAAACTSGMRTLAALEELSGGIVVSGYRLGDMRCTELAENLPEKFHMLLVASPGKVDDTELGENILFLPMPLKVHDLLSTLDMMISQLEQRRRREKSRRKIRTEAEKRTISEAKDLLMERNGMTEPEAHKYLQKCAMDSGTDIVETAEMVISLISL